jgi:hypothetical protein
MCPSVIGFVLVSRTYHPSSAKVEAELNDQAAFEPSPNSLPPCFYISSFPLFLPSLLISRR